MALAFYKNRKGSIGRFFGTHPSLQAYYQFDGGLQLSDNSGNANAMTNNGVATFINGKFGPALHCIRASSQYLSIASALGWNGTGAYTIMAWFSPSSQPSSGQLYTIGSVDTVSTNTSLWFGYYNNAGTLSIYGARTKIGIADQGPLVAQTLQIGTLYFVAVEYDGTNVSIYLNGQILGSPVAASGTGNATSTVSYIGSGAANNTTHLADGNFEEVAFFNTNISVKDLAQYYKQATSPSTVQRKSFLWTLTTITQTLSEVITDTDTLIRSVVRSLSETITDTDTFAFLKLKFQQLTESISDLDTLIKSTTRSFAETLTDTDTIIKNAIRTFSEAITDTDILATFRSILRTFTESITDSDFIQKFLNGDTTIWKKESSATATWTPETPSGGSWH